MTRQLWSVCDCALLSDLYPHLHTADVAALMGLSVSCVYNKAFGMGLKKTHEYLASDAAGRATAERQSPTMVAARFKPGVKVWNKGLKGWSPAGTEATRFKPGSKPQTWVPVGSYRVTKDGALEQKLNDNPGPSRVRWIPVSRTVWEAENGPIPNGYIVRFKAGCHTTQPELVTVDRLECISRIENMRRNSYHRFGPEVARLVQLRGALNRQINKHTKDNHESHQHSTPASA